MKKQYISLIVLLTSVIFCAAQTFADEIDEYYDRGYAALEQYDWATAIASFEAVLKLLDIDPIEAGERVKKLMADIEKNPETEDGGYRVIGFNKLWLDTYYYLGIAYAHNGDKANALRQVIDLRHIGRNDYADPLEDKINYIINKRYKIGNKRKD